MAAHRAKALYHKARTGKGKVAVLDRNLYRLLNTEPGGTDHVQGNAAQLKGQTHGTADFILDPGHAFLIGAHVRTENIILLITQGMGKGTNQQFLFSRIHLRVTAKHGLAPAMGKSRCRVLQGHGPGQTGTFDRAYIRRHAQSSNGGAGGDIVYHEYPFKAKVRLINMNNLSRP